MATPLVDAPTAVAAEINAASWTEMFLAERSYADWDLELTDDELHVDVVLAGARVESVLDDRGNLELTVPVQVAVRKRFGVGEQDSGTGRVTVTEIDALVELVDDIHNYFCTNRFGSYPNIVWEETRIVQAYSRQILREMRQFVGVIEINFRAYESLT